MILKKEHEHAAELAAKLGITNTVAILEIAMYLVDYGYAKWKQGSDEMMELSMKVLDSAVKNSYAAAAK